MDMPICFVCGKKMRKSRKKVNGIYKRKFLLLVSTPSRDFCSKRHLNKYFKNKKKYEERRAI